MRQSGFGIRQYLIARLPRLTARNDIGKIILQLILRLFDVFLRVRSTVGVCHCERSEYVIPTEMSETNGMECIPLMKEIRSTAPNGFARYDNAFDCGSVWILIK